MKLFRRVGNKVLAEGADLVTIPNVPIIATGIEYPLGTGNATFTEDDLRDAVRAAEEDTNIQHPRLKLAYGGPHEEQITEPAFGKVINLRLGDNDQVVYGDYVGVPRWLADVLPTAYPSRSFEGNRNVETVGGQKYKLVIHNVSLLGVHLPGVTSLPDLAAYYGSEQPEGVVIDSEIQASINVEDVRRQYYDDLKPEQAWWWIRAMELEASGGYLIVDDDEGDLYKVEFNVDGEEVTFGESQQVKIKYENVPKKQMAASVVAGLAGINDSMTVYATRAESRPTTREGGGDLDTKEAAKRLGLPEDATEEQIWAKIEEVQKPKGEEKSEGGEPEGEKPEDEKPEDEQPEPTAAGETPGEPAEPVTDDEGFVRLDKETYERMAASGKEASDFIAKQKKSEREQVVAAAIKAGKIAPASRENFLRLYEQDPQQTEKLLTASAEEGGLAAGLIPVEERGSGGKGAGNEEVEGLPDEWFGGAVAASKKRAEAQTRVTMAKEA